MVAMIIECFGAFVWCFCFSMWYTPGALCLCTVWYTPGAYVQYGIPLVLMYSVVIPLVLMYSVVYPWCLCTVWYTPGAYVQCGIPLVLMYSVVYHRCPCTPGSKGCHVQWAEGTGCMHMVQLP